MPGNYKAQYEELQAARDILLSEIKAHNLAEDSAPYQEARIVANQIHIIEISDYGKKDVKIPLRGQSPESPLIKGIINGFNSAGLGCTKIVADYILHDPHERYQPPQNHKVENHGTHSPNDGLKKAMDALAKNQGRDKKPK